MEYRLVFSQDSVDLYTEASVEQLYSIETRRHGLFRKKYVIPGNGIELVPNFLSRRKWTIRQQGRKLARIHMRSFLFGKKTVLELNDGRYISSSVNSKIYFREQKTLNTGVVIEPMKTSEQVRITHGEYFDPIISSLLTLLMVKKNRI